MANAVTVAKEDRSHARSTTNPRDLQRDSFALGLVAVTLMLLVSVVTRDPADPVSTPPWPIRLFYSPDITLYPQNDTITNACGYWGALISGLFIDAIGVSVSLVIAAGGGIATALLSRGGMNAPVLRSLGGSLFVLAMSTAASLSGWQPTGFPTVGAGGYLGAMASTWLEFHFAGPGAWILTITLLAISFLMVTDYALWYAGWIVFRSGAMASRKGIVTAVSVVPTSTRKPRKASTDLDSPIAGSIHIGTPTNGPATGIVGVEANGPPSQEPSIKIRSRAKGADGSTDAATAAAHSHENLVATKENAVDADHGKATDAKSGTAASGLTKLAGGAAAVGLAAAAAIGLKKKNAGRSDSHTPEESLDPGSPGTPNFSDAHPDGFEAAETLPEPAPVLRELEMDGEDLTLRGDEPHPGALIKIKTPKKRLDLQAEIDAAAEEFPEDMEGYHCPSVELLDESEDFSYAEQDVELRRKAVQLVNAFKSFGININVGEVEPGPVIALYEIELEPGLRLSKVTALADDLAIALRVPSVRIVAPIPGKNTVGIEIPNEIRQVVRLRDVIEESQHITHKMNIPVFLGKDVSGNPLTVDLAKMPHLLIAGRTGTGKSVCLNAIITSILMMCRPDEVRMLMIDPKMVELSGYGRLPHLMHPVVTDMKKAEAILAWAVEKMEERYALLAKAGVRHINSYNDLGREELYRRLEVDENDGASGIPERLPFIVIIADEMADLMMTAGKEVETHIIRLAQKSRAVGIHLILATQKPTVDVITGLIKSNLPARLSFQVASKTDSRVVLDENGADKLLGNGDMLFLWPGTSVIMRGQGTYLSDAEIDRVVAHCSTGEQNFVGELMNLKIEEPEGAAPAMVAGGLKKRDELYESAIEVVVREGRGSVSLLQRCLGIGYGRAARLIDYMAEDGLVGDYNGSQAREVTITMADWERMQGLESTSTASLTAGKPAASFDQNDD